MKKLLFSVALGSFVLTANSQTDAINVVTTATPFLRISPDARSGGMGDVAIATTPDGTATFNNASKVPFATVKSQLAATYTPWLKDITNDVFLANLSGYYQIDNNQGVHGGLRYFSLGNMKFVDENGTELNTVNPREFSLEAGYSRKLSDKFGVAATFRYISSNLGSGTVNGKTYRPGSAVSGDFAAFYNGLNETGNGLTAGLTISNIGSKISYSDDPQSKSFLPANLALGVAYTTAFDEDNRLTVATDYNHLLVPKVPENLGGTTPEATQATADYYNTGVLSGMVSSFSNGAHQFAVGAEYGYINQFFVRAGYFTETKAAGGRSYLTAGVGVKYNVLGLNFSYLAPSGSGLNRNPLSNTMRFTLLFDLANGK